MNGPIQRRILHAPVVLSIGMILLLGACSPVLAQEGDDSLLEPIFPERMEELQDRPEPVRDASDTESPESPPPADEAELEVFDRDPESAVPYLDRILAVVENRVITLRDYRDAYGDSSLERGLLRDLIDETLIDVAVEFYGIADRRSEIEEFVDRQLEQQKSQPEEFQQFLREQGTTEEEYRRMMRTEIEQTQLIQRLYPDLNPNGSDTGATVRNSARMMRFSEEETAREVYEQLGENPSLERWNELYEEHAIDQPFLGSHGELDWFGWGTYDSQLEYTLYSLPLYGVSEPVSWRGDYVLMYRQSVRLSPGSGEPDQSTRQYFDRYRTRLLQSHLPILLADEFTVHVPYSIREYLDDQPR